MFACISKQRSSAIISPAAPPKDGDDEGAGAQVTKALVGGLPLLIGWASGDIVEADRAALREAGFSDRDIWDIAAVAGFFNMSNRMASAVDMRPDAEYHAQAR